MMQATRQLGARMGGLRLPVWGYGGARDLKGHHVRVDEVLRADVGVHRVARMVRARHARVLERVRFVV